MADGSKPPPGKVSEELIIVRRIQPDEAGAKGGAWKIAYADFVTAMMAFFLVMWLINAANEKTKAQVASYFNPVKLVDNTTSAKGIKTPGDRSAKSSGEKGGDSAPSEASPDAKAEEQKTEEKPAESKPSAEAPAEKSEKSEEKEKPSEPSAHGKAAEEAALFEDPFKLLSQIARDVPGGSDGKSEKSLVITDSEVPGSPEGQLTRDPFDPLAWKLVPPAGREELQEHPPQEETAQPAPPKPEPKAAEPTEPEAKPAEQKTDSKESPAAKAAVKEAQAIRETLGRELEALGKRHPELDVTATREGIVISLTDTVGFDMFDVGSAKPRPVVVKLMEKVAAAVRDFKGKLIVRGHTDGRPYRGRGYDNWRLSMARAQMAYYMLIRAGVDENAVERIEGYADKALLRKDQPESAENRRIEILLKVDDP